MKESVEHVTEPFLAEATRQLLHLAGSRRYAERVATRLQHSGSRGANFRRYTPLKHGPHRPVVPQKVVVLACVAAGTNLHMHQSSTLPRTAPHRPATTVRGWTPPCLPCNQGPACPVKPHLHGFVLCGPQCFGFALGERRITCLIGSSMPHPSLMCQASFVRVPP